MRIFILSALVALCSALPMRTQATSLQSNLSISQHVSVPIHHDLLERIIRHLQQNEGMDYDKLCEFWCEGSMQITKIPVGYLISVPNDNGGVVIISVIDDL